MKIFPVKLTDTTKVELTAVAKASGLFRSEWIRQQIQEHFNDMAQSGDDKEAKDKTGA